MSILQYTLGTETFTKRSAAVAYLVQQGISEPLAKAAIEECCNYEPAGPSDDLLYDAENMVPRTYSADEIRVVWNTMEDMLEVTPEGIELDGDLHFDLSGNVIY